MRLFIAIQVPASLHKHCRSLQKRFAELKETSDFHLTLQFLGDDIPEKKSILEALSKIEFKPFEIKLGNAVPFGTRSNPKGIWIECYESKPLKKLASRIRRSMRHLGYHPDKPFKAHITLGRYKKKPETMPKPLYARKMTFIANSFELIQSHLAESSPQYKTVATFGAKKGIGP